MNFLYLIIGISLVIASFIVFIFARRNNVKNTFLWALFPFTHGLHEIFEAFETVEGPFIIVRLDLFLGFVNCFILLAAILESNETLTQPVGKVTGLFSIIFIGYFIFFLPQRIIESILILKIPFGPFSSNPFRFFHGFIMSTIIAISLAISSLYMIKISEEETKEKIKIIKFVIIAVIFILIFGFFESFEPESEVFTLLHAVSTSMVLTIPFFYIYETSRDYMKRLETMNKFMKAISEAENLKELLRIILSMAYETMEFDWAGFYLIDKSSRTAELIFQKGISANLIGNKDKINIDDSPYDTVFIKGESIFPSISYNFFSQNKKNISVGSIPLKSNKKIIGAFNIISKEKDFFSNNVKELLLSVVQGIGTFFSKMKLEDALRKAHARSEFYKDLFAHDLNNVLNNIYSSSQLGSIYLKQPDNFNKISEMFITIEEQIARGNKLISNVKTLSDLEIFKMSLETIDVCQILREATAFIKSSYRTKIIDFTISSSSINPYVSANSLLLDVFENILLNSIRYNMNLVIEIEIVISDIRKEGDNFIKIEFRDNGIGISGDKERIFQRGYKNPNSKGMGFGLTLVKTLIKDYKGFISVEDRVKGDYSKGSNFVLLLPFAK